MIKDQVRYIDDVYLNFSLSREAAEFAEKLRLDNPPEPLDYPHALRRTPPAIILENAENN